MADTVLITGGAGFIGRHLAHALLSAGHKVRILDSFIDQVHGDRGTDGLDADAEIIRGDVRDGERVAAALRGVDKVVHLAAEVGVGQSMYEVDHYVSVNDHGTAVLFQQLIKQPVRRVVVASSMSVYGEGLYRTVDGKLVEDAQRVPRRAGDISWDPIDGEGRPMSPVPTPETKRQNLASVYAITKYVQERLTLTVAPAYGMEGAALRLWNVYGPGQALSNPYTGVLAIFAARLHNRQPPMIFEDGQQRRDFVHVEDVARAFRLALDHPNAAGGVFNIASGVDRSVTEVASDLAEAMGHAGLRPEVTQQARAGDIRHNIADIGLARTRLGYAPQRLDFRSDLAELAEWVGRQAAQDRVQDARRELELRGLVA
ncbi:NAD-dependent epimerase/dehydratase family protein [Plastoroseomonas arctica]|uniref:NAD-dependent epimerase/dehydratase family protein n=1 Tax=Plastoroseomonas arctica TaxID=1509237 RepID=A0AAF1JUR1_9PROT|nr:NAD-dependent epimerase/dehydratase family protein [Plastoroseomonas arctica]MBR0654175.1 NAD-dependent epimerase/dehydratase family protein [Plastoroseomonas arctica]